MDDISYVNLHTCELAVRILEHSNKVKRPDGVDIHDLLDFVRKNDPSVHNMALEIADIAVRYVSECIEAAAVRLVPSVH